MIVPEQERGNHDPDKVDAHVHDCSYTPLDEALMLLVDDRVQERGKRRGQNRIAKEGAQRPPPQHRQRPEHERVPELAQDQIPYPQARVEVRLRREPEDRRHQGKGRQRTACGAGD